MSTTRRIHSWQRFLPERGADMAVTLTGLAGLFTRLGRSGGTLNNLNGFINKTPPASAVDWGSGGPLISCLQTNFNNIQAQYQSADQITIDTLFTQLAAYRSAAANLRSYIQNTLAIPTLISQVNDDTPLPAQTVQAPMTVLLAQMISGSASVAAPTVSVSGITAGAANNGNGVCIASILQPFNGLASPY